MINSYTKQADSVKNAKVVLSTNKPGELTVSLDFKNIPTRQVMN